MTKKINYQETDSFKKDFKKLIKKFITLPDDLVVAKRNAIELFHLDNIDNQSVVLMPGYSHKHIKFYKLRKFACKSLKGKGVQSGIRLIYAHHVVEKTITFIEIYFKADQAQEDPNRIKAYSKDYDEC